MSLILKKTEPQLRKECLKHFIQSTNLELNKKRQNKN